MKRQFIGYSLLILFIACIFGMLSQIKVGATHNYPPVPTQPTLHQDPEVITVMQRLGLNYSKLNLIYGDNGRPSATTSFAYFRSPNTMYVSPSAPQDKLDTIISHEYIHYIQFSVDTAGATALYPYTDGLQNTDTWFYNRMATYRTNLCPDCSMSRENEAVACTEMPDRALREDFVAWCNKYLPQRYSLPL
jgi:hypothetical protein